jgi:hypothetical protein
MCTLSHWILEVYSLLLILKDLAWLEVYLRVQIAYFATVKPWVQIPVPWKKVLKKKKANKESFS